MTFRVLGPHERGRFAPEAWGHLVTLWSAGLVTAEELETLIDRALTQLDGRIGLEDLRVLSPASATSTTGSAATT